MGQKNKIVLLSSIIGTLFIFYAVATFLIIPDIKKSSKLQEDIATLEQNLRNLQNFSENLEDIYSSLKGYNLYLKNFQEGFEKEDLENLFALYAKEVKVEEYLKEDLEKIVKTDFIVDMKIDSPINFYKLIEYINQNSLPIKFDYPIIFEKSENFIDLKLTAVVYSLK